jgi:integrase
MSIQNIGTNKWRIVVKLGRDPQTGKVGKIDRRINGSKEDAQEFEAECRGNKIKPSKKSLIDFLNDTWLPSLQVDPVTIESYKYGIKYIKDSIGFVPLSEITAWHIEMAIHELPEGHKRERAKKVLSGGLTSATRWRLIPYNPIHSAQITIGDGVKRVRSTYTQNEVNAILDAFCGHRAEAVVVTMLGCGLRKEEAIALSWQDIDLATGVIEIHRVWARGKDNKPEIKKTKTKKSTRKAYISGWWLTRLNELAPEPAYDDNGNAKEQPLWPGKSYAYIRPDAATRGFRRRIESVGLRYLPIGHLRHTYATLALANHVDVALVSLNLGHANISTTVNRYVIPQEQNRKAGAKQYAKVVQLRPSKSKQRKLSASV